MLKFDYVRCAAKQPGMLQLLFYIGGKNQPIV